MANYRETEASGTSYTRARTVLIHNDLDFKAIEFQEEDVVISGDKSIRQQAGAVVEEFTVDNMYTAFPILDEEYVDTGATITYAEVHGILHSLYYHLATMRDARELAEAQEEAARIAAAEQAVADRLAAEAAAAAAEAGEA